MALEVPRSALLVRLIETLHRVLLFGKRRLLLGESDSYSRLYFPAFPAAHTTFTTDLAVLVMASAEKTVSCRREQS